jgi:hypothetical protein
LTRGFTLKGKLIVLLIGICFNMMLFNTDYFYSIKVYGHLFTTDETATFVAVLDQMQTELKLILANLEDNNVSLAQNHASKADSLLSPKIWVEIAEDNPRLASDLRNALIRLQNVSSSSETQLNSVSELVNDLNKRLEEDAMVRIAQLPPSSSNIIEALKSLGSIFGGSNDELDQDTKIQALAFANVIDSVLTNYGKACGIGFDMTNMSNMAMIGNSNNPGSMVKSNPVTRSNSGASNVNMTMNMNSINISSNNMTEHDAEMSTGYPLVNVSDYQSANALATKAFEVFNAKLKHTTMSNNKNITAYVTNLENGLTQLNDSIAKRASPLDVMMIVHTQIHPYLLEAFDLQLRK